jgi:hypothetical protein
MDSRIFTDRLRGCIAAFFLMIGLNSVPNSVAFISTRPGIALSCAFALFMAFWLFFNKPYSTALALAWIVVFPLGFLVLFLFSSGLDWIPKNFWPADASAAVRFSHCWPVIEYALLVTALFRLRHLEA